MTQVVDVVSAENLPAAQLRHVEAPALGKYLPAIQAVHVSDCSIENVPATQVVHVLAPELERVPATHAVQADPSVDDPRALPAAHAEQCNRPSPSKPGRQAHDLPSAVEVALVAH